MKKRKKIIVNRAGRPLLRSPGRPSVGNREHRRRFWKEIAQGRTSDQAGKASGFLGLWETACSAKVEGWRQKSRSARFATCHSLNGKRLLFSGPKVPGYEPSLGTSIERRPRSRGSLGETLLPGVGVLYIEHLLLSGTLNFGRSAPRLRNLHRTRP